VLLVLENNAINQFRIYDSLAPGH